MFGVTPSWQDYNLFSRMQQSPLMQQGYVTDQMSQIFNNTPSNNPMYGSMGSVGAQSTTGDGSYDSSSNIGSLGGSLAAMALSPSAQGDLNNTDPLSASSQRKRALGGSIGGSTGAIGGAAIGTAILPGVGTVIGSLLGSLLGGGIGKGIARPTGNFFQSLFR